MFACLKKYAFTVRKYFHYFCTFYHCIFNFSTNLIACKNISIYFKLSKKFRVFFFIGSGFSFDFVSFLVKNLDIGFAWIKKCVRKFTYMFVEMLWLFDWNFPDINELSMRALKFEIKCFEKSPVMFRESIKIFFRGDIWDDWQSDSFLGKSRKVYYNIFSIDTLIHQFIFFSLF